MQPLGKKTQKKRVFTKSINCFIRPRLQQELILFYISYLELMKNSISLLFRFRSCCKKNKRQCTMIMINVEKILSRFICFSFKKRKNIEFQNKDQHVKKVTKVYSKNVLVKSSKNKIIFSHAFYLTLWLMKLPKIFQKNTHFENMTADFLLGCQNLLLYFTPEMMHFQA